MVVGVGVGKGVCDDGGEGEGGRGVVGRFQLNPPPPRTCHAMPCRGGVVATRGVARRGAGGSGAQQRGPCGPCAWRARGGRRRHCSLLEGGKKWKG